MSEPKPGDVLAGKSGTRWFVFHGADQSLRVVSEEAASWPIHRLPDARPLVVIDPEDGDAVDRLASLLRRWLDQFPGATAESCLRDALREFVKQPAKPDGNDDLDPDAIAEALRKFCRQHGARLPEFLQ